jgi:hypothetical protein
MIDEKLCRIELAERTMSIHVTLAIHVCLCITELCPAVIVPH